MKIGIVGGAFNPIHIGHLNSANEVARKLGLQQVYFVVASRPPHKEEESLMATDDRFAMVELACADNPLFTPSNLEINRAGPSYTIDTMRHFQKLYGNDVYFILGQDAMEDVGSWKAASTLLKTCNFVVVTRPGYDSSLLLDLLQSVVSVNYRNLALVNRHHEKAGIETIGLAGAPSVIKLLPVTGLDISSTLIRNRLDCGDDIRYLVPEPVRHYLLDKKRRVGVTKN